MTWILTASGKHFDFADPQPDQICIADIALGLSRESRFAGQCNEFYSVAQHSLLVAGLVPSELKLEALLHDATEAYCKDIPRPLKMMLPDYKAIEDRVNRAIRERYGLPEEKSDDVKRADMVMLATERRDLMPVDDGFTWDFLKEVAPTEAIVIPYSPRVAYYKFLGEAIVCTTKWIS